MKDELGFPVRNFQLGVAWVALLNSLYCIILAILNFQLTSFLLLLPLCVLSVFLFIFTLKNKREALYIGAIFFGLQIIKIISKPISYELDFFSKPWNWINFRYDNYISNSSLRFLGSVLYK